MLNNRCVDSEEAWPRKCFLLGFLCDGFSWRAYRDKEDGGKDGKVQRGLHMGLDEVRHDGVRVRHGQDRAHQEQESGSHESHRTTRHHWLHDRVRLVAIVVLCRCCCGSHVTRRSSQSLLTSSSGKSFVHAYKNIYVCCFCFKMLHLANAVAVWLYGRMVDRYVKDETLFAKAQRY